MKIKFRSLEDSQKPEIQKIINELKHAKSDAITSGNENKANTCWREIEAINLNILFINTFHKIKSKKYREAWYDLEKCEIICGFLEKNSTEQYLAQSRVSFIKDIVAKWQSLYPYSIFFSPGLKIGYYTCSICGSKIKPRSRCNHKKNIVYNGELCLHYAHDLEFLEISFVKNPVQKYSIAHPNDENLNFTPLEYLSERLDNAFEKWDYNWTKMKFPIEHFKNIDRNDKCPCESEKQFKNCCINKNEIEIPHINFIFFNPLPKDKENIIFPY